ncbi:peptide-methionine (R)-S-oxide reductase MsrB [Fulvimarina sp. 2208YS6-2-32]|uniref:peptide-methionine (R)-S-oxide reductase n=1 Tax=Fulvimarina uroteuthidis TaxID=3098149 RepID=A0ABU5I4E2_9HYPH|nr:peptide-methionine (R)-S-oxide reductase MsrB [Fulvimarina sp. 2208YS6-2-32]MDY8110254.1 peptide-methionine (R)-S-oxide reductase MsrB [Fulvimarina sp. 2208YS6-2-32]
MPRRTFLASATALVGAATFGLFMRGNAESAEGEFPVSLSTEEWRERLTPAQFSVLREEATEAPFSSPLNKNEKAGIYACAGCDNPVYSSRTKFDSGTGWPSFYAPLSESAVGTATDYKLIYPRTEVHCASCGGHLGHIFNDGPKPTGKRHCLNGVALNFVPGATSVG